MNFEHKFLQDNGPNHFSEVFSKAILVDVISNRDQFKLILKINEK